MPLTVSLSSGNGHECLMVTFFWLDLSCCRLRLFAVVSGLEQNGASYESERRKVAVHPITCVKSSQAKDNSITFSKMFAKIQPCEVKRLYSTLCVLWCKRTL